MKNRNLLLLAAVIIFCSCNPRSEFQKAQDFKGSMTIVVDSCEYLVCKSPHEDFGWVMTHKGNCKFCKIRK